MARERRYPPDDPREWLNRARSNFVRAKNLPTSKYLEDNCFDAQQAAEKAIKAVLVGRGLKFPFTHDLERLITLLRSAGVRVPKYIDQADQLTAFASESRYPGITGPVTKAEFRRAVRTAEKVLQWATRQVEKQFPALSQLDPWPIKLGAP